MWWLLAAGVVVGVLSGYLFGVARERQRQLKALRKLIDNPRTPRDPSFQQMLEAGARRRARGEHVAGP